ncbi:MAG: hypothetical protein H6713_26835 [Myxococcales bacterium]|nr:hypothetical protein [Myxococcales bacterium]
MSARARGPGRRPRILRSRLGASLVRGLAIAQVVLLGAQSDEADARVGDPQRPPPRDPDAADDELRGAGLPHAVAQRVQRGAPRGRRRARP